MYNKLKLILVFKRTKLKKYPLPNNLVICTVRYLSSSMNVCYIQRVYIQINALITELRFYWNIAKKNIHPSSPDFFSLTGFKSLFLDLLVTSQAFMSCCNSKFFIKWVNMASSSGVFFCQDQDQDALQALCNVHNQSTH